MKYKRQYVPTNNDVSSQLNRVDDPLSNLWLHCIRKVLGDTPSGLDVALGQLEVSYCDAKLHVGFTSNTHKVIHKTGVEGLLDEDDSLPVLRKENHQTQ